MQETKLTATYALLTIPLEVLEESGIQTDALLQITAEKGKIEITAVTEADTCDFVCDGDCENCPINKTDCDGDCKACPCKNHCEEKEV